MWSSPALVSEARQPTLPPVLDLGAQLQEQRRIAETPLFGLDEPLRHRAEAGIEEEHRCYTLVEVSPDHNRVCKRKNSHGRGSWL